MNNRIRVTALAVGLVGIMLGGNAAAQVTIQMTTAASQNCTATTDSNGLSLVPNSTTLAATGVTLTGAGCGAAPADFQASITVPGTTQVGNAVNVQWSAGAQATECTYGGTPGLDGWPVGGSACSGSACNGPHNALVTPSTAQTYALSITCTNATGYKTGSLVAQPRQDPPTPNPFALTVTPSTVQVNSPVSVSWSVNGATSCTGSADLNGSSVNLAGWTDTTSPASPRSVTPALAGTYALTLVCGNPFGSVTSTPGTGALVASPVTSDNCVDGGALRLTAATIRYPNTGNTTRPNVDLTHYENIWGHGTNSDTAVLWPGVNGSAPAVVNWGKTQYIASKFTVPAGFPATGFDKLRYSTYFSGPTLTMSVSSTCGDFAPSNGNCLTTGVATGGEFKKMVLSPATNGCPLMVGQTYFVNLKMTAPLATDCSNQATCTLATNNIN